MTNQNKSTEQNQFFVIAIGSSAGGVQALETFFKNLPDLPNAAFVIIPHLSPDYESMMTVIIQRQTQLPVQTVTENLAIAPQKVYVIPPGQNMTLEDGKFNLREQTERLNYPINIFFKSVAKSQKEKAICILLSGTGTDGNEGLQAISKAGGIALVQSAETAEFTSMPTNAIPSGFVDEILSPQELANTVYDIVRFVDSNNEPSKIDQQGIIHQEKLQEILDILLETQGINFSEYKVSTLGRRILHRCALNSNMNLDRYINLLKESEQETYRLCQDLLIGATNFFRDPPAWEFLQEQILPQIINSLSLEQQVRIWIPACATGEEAYSMAMIVYEALENANKSIPVKIFATDLDSEALEIASKGFYESHLTREISQERLDKFFKIEPGGYQVKPLLREMLIFASHDLTKNAGFSKMHLVSCRNVLIYMQQRLQNYVLRLLHFALVPQGVLFLGSAEVLGEAIDQFTVLEPRWKIYRRSQNSQLSLTPVSSQVIATPLKLSNTQKSNNSFLEKKIESAYKFYFGNRQVTCVLIDHNNRPLHIFYDSAKLISLPLGEVKLDIASMLPNNLKLPLITAIHRARREKTSVLYTAINVEHDNQELMINMRVGPESRESVLENNLFIILEIHRENQVMSSVSLSTSISTETSQQLAELENELQQTRENLQVTIEELETTNEEQQATNEELLASNEELQSTNEELQSVNEELYTLNNEYQQKIQQLTELNTDIDNLLSSTTIGVLFLDNQLKIRKFTPAATRIINLTSTDQNRPIAHITNNLNCSNLIELLEEVIKNENPIEKEVIIPATGENLLMHINLYLRQNNTKDGLVVTFVNIDQLKNAEHELNQVNYLLENFYETSPVGLGLQNQQLQYIRINQALAEMNQLTISESLGKTLAELNPDLNAQVEPLLHQVIVTKKAVLNTEIYYTNNAVPDSESYWSANYYPINLLDGSTGVASVVTEITQLKQIQQKLQQSQNFVQHITESSPDIIFVYHLDEQKIIYINSAVQEILGYQPEEITEMNKYALTSLTSPEDISSVKEYLQNFNNISDDQVNEIELRIMNKNGNWLWFYIRSVIFHRTDNTIPQQILGICTNISHRKQIEEELIERNHSLEQAIDTAQSAIIASQSKTSFLANISHEIRTPMNSILGVSQLLDRTALNPLQRELLQTLQRNSENLLNLINDVLDISKIEAQELKIQVQEFNLFELNEIIINSFTSQTDNKGIELIMNIDPQIPRFLIGDNFRLNRILNNLVSNAIKYTENGRIIITISPDAHQTESENEIKLYFSVSDTGIGIPLEEQKNIFQAFIQVDNVITRHNRGTGLGLAICKSLVELMGGEMGVESTVGEGSTFWFTAIFEIANIPDKPGSVSVDKSTSPPSPSVKNFELLIVEDNSDNQNLLQLMLESLGYNQIEKANHGEEALEKLAAKQYYLIFMDCYMPILNGYETTSRVREKEGDEQHTIIIGLTANALLGAREQCLEAGMDNYLSKPIDIQELEQLLNRYLDF